MKNSILKFLYVIAYHVGLFKLFYFLKRKQQTVITYHNVICDDIFDNNILHLGVSCSESAFAKQLNIISNRFNITTKVGVPGTCIVSFDDGYKNNIEIAVPHLNAKNVSGLFFVPASYFENQQVLWVDQLLMWVSYVPFGSYLILGNTFVITEKTDSRALVWNYIYQQILSNYSVLKSLIRDLDNHFSFKDLKKIINRKMYDLRFEAMSIEELEKIKKMGHKLGCHSFKHDILSLLEDEQLERDFSMCALQAKNYNTTIYSYPFGGKDEVSARVTNKCQKYGYSAGFLNYEADTDNIYALGRMSLGEEKDKYFIEAKLCGFEKVLKKILIELKSTLDRFRYASFNQKNC